MTHEPFAKVETISAELMDVTLHSSTLPGADVFTVIEIAASVGCGTICAYINAPTNGLTMPGAPPKTFPVIQPAEIAAVKTHLVDFGVSISNLEFFPLWPDTDIELYRPALDRGAELGARRVVTHVHDPDEARAIDSLGRFTRSAEAMGLSVGLEFIGMAQGCRTFEDAVRLTIGVGRPDCGIAVDALHFFRTCGDLQRLTALPRDKLAYGQICDGKGLHMSLDYFADARNRLVPGHGDFPLLEFIRALEGIEVDVEIPNSRLDEEGVSLFEHARRCVSTSNSLLETARQKS